MGWSIRVLFQVAELGVLGQVSLSLTLRIRPKKVSHGASAAVYHVF